MFQGILIFSVLSAAPLTYNRTYHYPTWALVLGWSMALASMVAIPIYFFSYLFSRPGNTIQEVSLSVQPLYDISLF